MKFQVRMWITLIVLTSLVGVNLSEAATKFSSPVDAKFDARPSEAVRVVPHTLDEILITQNFESGQMPPAGWTRTIFNTGNPTYTWHLNQQLAPYEGSGAAFVLYAEDLSLQNEWLISPVLDLTTNGIDWSVSFWWQSSYYWGVSPYDNYDLELRISTDGGTTWLPNVLWVEDQVGVFNNYEWYQAVVDLSAYLSYTNVKLAWRYHGADGAQAGVDLIVVEGTAGGATGNITGTVTDLDSEAPVHNATVRIPSLNLTTTTNLQGQFSFNNVAEGTYSLIFSHLIYTTDTLTGVIVTANETVDVEFDLERSNPDLYYFASTAAAVPIVDNAFAVMTLNVPMDEIVFDVDVVINITHTWDGDLDIWLVNPDGDSVQLYQDNISISGDNFTNTRFDDEAATPIGSGQPPYTGSFRPEEELEAYDGFMSQGTWRLVVYDNNNADVGQILNFALLFTFEGTSASDPAAAMPESFAFHGNYPNPFNAATSFRFDMGRAGHASLILFNILGEEVARVVDRSLQAGSHTVAFDASRLPSGMYLARFTAPGFADTRKVMLLK